MENDLLILKSGSEKDYALLDSGEGEKLERYGSVILCRPDPQALWPKRLSDGEWNKADAVFTHSKIRSRWIFKKKIPEKWPVRFGGLGFWIRPGTFKHTGVFPEQIPNWEWINRTITGSQNPVSVLNLFGYTGGATLTSLAAGARVCHVDASRAAIGWARDNAKLTGLSERGVRWIPDDTMTFLKKEIRRGNKYDGIIMDPPAFGHGTNNEVWKIEKHFLELMSLAKNVLSPKPLFFLINGYASGYSGIAYRNNIDFLLSGFGGKLESGELSIEEEKSGRLLPTGIFARWSRGL